MNNKQMFYIAKTRLERAIHKLYHEDLPLNELTVSALQKYFASSKNYGEALNYFLLAIDQFEEEKLSNTEGWPFEDENDLMLRFIASL